MRIALAVAAVLITAAAMPAAVMADNTQPGRDISKLDYDPQPATAAFKAGEIIPTANACSTLAPRMSGRRFNPSGKYTAFDNNVFEVLCLPYRGAGDKSATDPMGNGGNPQHGFCAPNPVPRPSPEAPLSSLAGECPNHQLEYLDYYEETMQDILGEFGVTFRRYKFDNPGSGNTTAGDAYNPAAIVPGADHGDETIVIGAHYDQTTEGPASAWDSAEGHAQIIRVAKIMADYWRSTGTRPSATVKFIPWDGEESGTLGSLDYTDNNIVPGQEQKVRGYWNTDPCAGGYPAFRNGQPARRIALGIQVARPDEIPSQFDKARVEAFNERAPDIVEEVFTKIDDTVSIVGGRAEVFISKQEKGADADNAPGGPVAIGGSRPVLFSSDWANFLDKGVPFFNPGPEVTGPSDEGDPNNPDALAILHTPNDNIETLNRLTGPDQTGKTFSDGWIKGMEMCSNLLAWGMLRGDQGGAQTANTDVVAYYEALPNEAVQAEAVKFDARGSYQYATTTSPRELVDGALLRYEWDFGDGSTGSGQTPQHRYAQIGVYQSKLTVTNTATGQRDTMVVPITVIASDLRAPVLTPPPAEDPDGNFGLAWNFNGTLDNLEGFAIEEAPDFTDLLADDAEGGPAARWTVTPSQNADIEPWQQSDSATTKVRGNQRSGGARSFWTGVRPQNFKQPPTVQSGESLLTLKDPISVPAGTSPTLSYFSLFQNEGDDFGIVEVAPADGSVDFRPVDTIAAVSTAAGGPSDEAICNPSEPETLTTPLRKRTADLAKFAGQQIRVRFRLVLGPENRALSQPCGWYVDDIKVSTGTFSEIGTTPVDPKTFAVRDRSAGTYTYRVKGRYAGGLKTGPSNAESVKVTRPGSGAQGTAGSGNPIGAGGSTGQGTGGQSNPVACKANAGLIKVGARPRGSRLTFTFARRVDRPVTIDVFQQSRGRRVIGERLVARFANQNRGVRWNGRANRPGRKVTDGYFFVRYRVKVGRAQSDTRRIALRRVNGRFRTRPAFYDTESCGLLRSYKLERPVFGGPSNRALLISYRLLRSSRVTVEVLRGAKVVRRFAPTRRREGITHRQRFDAEGLPRGDYRVRLRAVSVRGETVTRTLTSRRI